MKRRCPLFTLMSICLLVSACSLNKLAVDSSSGLLYSSSKEVESFSNYELFKSGIAGHLILMEGLLSESPENEQILSTLTKGYAGFAFAVNESDMLNEEWGEAKTDNGKKQALFNYTRAFNFGLRYLKIHKIEMNDLVSRMNETQGVAHFLDQRLSSDKKDLELVLFTAQSLAALINLQKDNISLVAQLPIAKSMFDWVCMKDPKIYYGTCDIFYGAYEAGRPKMLGGNPEKGKDIFLRAIENHPHNWLLRASYMQYYLIPQNDKTGFDQQLEFLKEKKDNFDAFHIYSGEVKNENSWNREEHLRFYQALALKRFELMDKFQKQFF